MPNYKKQYGLYNHAGVFWKVIHSEKANRTSVILYVNSRKGYYASEYKVVTTGGNEPKPENLKKDLHEHGAELLNSQLDEKTREKILKQIYKEHGYEPYQGDLQTEIHIQYYKNDDAPENLFYQRYLFPGRDHWIKIVVDSDIDDPELQKWFLDWKEAD